MNAAVVEPARLEWVGAAMLPEGVRQSLLGSGSQYEFVTERVGLRELTVFRNRPENLRVMLEEVVASCPDSPFLVTPDRTWSFAAALVDIDAIARVLVEDFRIRPGDRVGVVSANSPEYALTMWSILSVGAVVTSFNGWWTGPELSYGLELTTPKIILGDEPRLARLENGSTGDSPVLPLVELHERAQARRCAGRPVVTVHEDAPAVILFTSGTTGRPKGATLSHRNIVNFALTTKASTDMARLLASAKETPQGASILASPMFHVSGMLGVLMTGGAMGSKLVFPPPGRWDPLQYLELTEKHRVSSWSGVPTQYWRLLRFPDFDAFDLTCVTSVGAGGATFPPELIRELSERMPWVFLSNGYGMSETVGLGTRIGGPLMVAQPDSVGSANMTVEVEIRDEAGAVLSEGDIGEICLRTPSVFLGYWENDEATKAVLDPNGWYRTGDFGRIHDGLLFLESRIRDMILRGGENIYPIEIENRLVEHPDIEDAAVIGIDHQELGQEVKAFVIVTAGSRVTVSDVQEWVGAALASFKVPAYVDFRSSLPYTETGKVMKHELEREQRAVAPSR